MKKYKQTITVPLEELQEINTILQRDSWDEDSGRHEIIYSLTAKFEDGNEVDIKVINSDDEEAGPWIDAVLFDENGSELSCMEPSFDELEGKYTFWPISGDEYIVIIKEGN